MPKGRVGRARIMHRDVRAGLGQNKRNLATDAQASARHQRASAAHGKPRRHALRVFDIVITIQHMSVGKGRTLYSLTLPETRPLISHFLTSSVKTTTGSMTSVPPAAIFPHSQPSYCMKLTIATGAVIAFVRVRISA